MKTYSKLLSILLILGMAVYAGIAAFAAEDGGAAGQTGSTGQTTNDLVISQAVLDRIRAADPANYDRHVADYKALLVKLGIHDSIRQEIEKLVLDGYALPEILIGCEFLYHSFGTVADLRSFAVQQAAGASWERLFTEYNRNQPVFKPRSFPSDYLEKLMSTPGLTADDIMIADRLANATGRPFEEIIEEKLTSPEWRGITAKAGILFGGDKLPRVQIKNEQLQAFQSESGLSAARIAEAFVIAHKVGKTAETVVGKLKEGYSPEAVFAESYEQKYR
ncbi:hypothetical protein FE783_08085 [Paenibacillus mesophilus]|uniref:hypothetical protein n=1 Tax=Paenibacillus mesophilus TaxID=2582849 RepID=UPI00110D9A25|nr:hypothetical protein [Paenibacillus mesophilus]TMV50644.1 hypothetical protein FE783_08085 [Paenibacillus mesophilus]